MKWFVRMVRGKRVMDRLCVFSRCLAIVSAFVAWGASPAAAGDKPNIVLVMADDSRLRGARLRLMRRLEALLLQLADVSEIVPEA